MFIHYLKIAFRNMWKYKNQSLISILGLAVGFTCFALATLWIVYEMTYDNFHKNAKQMYVVYRPDSFNPTGINKRVAYPLAAFFKETFPEIADAAPVFPSSRRGKVTVEDVEFPAAVISVDSSFLRMFDIRIIEGSIDFLIPGSNKIAITQEKAKQLFGNEHPIGKMISLYSGSSIEICAIVSGMSKRSNYAFDLIQPLGGMVTNPSQMWYYTNDIIIELLPGTNVETFEKKLYEHEIDEANAIYNKLTIKPLTKLRYLDPNIDRDIKFQHILIFALSGLLVILCSLFNYLTLFMSRFRMRQKELALRVVCGASGGSLLVMLSVEFLLTLLISVALGCCLTQIVHKPFLTLSDIQMNLPDIYKESLIYIGGVILVSLLAFWLILFIFQRRSLNVSIRRSNKNMFRKISVVAQLLISIGFAFCAIIILKQMYFLRNTDELGFSFKNRGALVVFEGFNVTQGTSFDDLAKQLSSEIPLVNQLKQIPEITEVVDASGLNHLLPQSGRRSQGISSWDDKPANVELSIERMEVSPEYIAFYDFQLLEGEMLIDSDPETTVLINEIAAKAFGWHNPIGKHFDDKYTVKGVIRHVCNFAPTIPAKPVYYSNISPQQNFSVISITRSGSSGTIAFGRLVLFKYHEGTWKSCMEKIEQLKDEFKIDNIYNAEEVYDEFLKSENALLKLLTFVSAICILICVFGFVSLVSLTCEERRKEIAIRKINGATSGDILSMFAKEYFILLVIGAVIAFTTGYFIMQRWLENYVKQTNIPVWIYLGIICALALVIVLCIGWQVYRASIENPADVVKSE